MAEKSGRGAELLFGCFGEEGFWRGKRRAGILEKRERRETEDFL